MTPDPCECAIKPHGWKEIEIEFAPPLRVVKHRKAAPAWLIHRGHAR
jgi:hypothetical protein